MADDKPGLLSKVAMFVRNPTKDWSELDQPQDSDSSGYDKLALKAMIERKRQNDFVRKREFDQLRKLRNRDPGAMANMGRPSFFQNSLPSDLGGRAVTIKKIDEIEAQMSRQWWKAKSGGATQPYTVPRDSVASRTDTAMPLAAKIDSSLTRSFASTLPFQMEPAGVAEDGDEFLSTLMASVPGAETGEGDDAHSDAKPGFSTSRLLAIEVNDVATDPELEEAAIRFANSDDSGAERGLLAALRGHDLAAQAAQSWTAALLELYRATQRRGDYEAAAAEFASHLNGLVPAWSALGSSAAASSMAPSPIWCSPATLTAVDMEQLRAVMLSSPMPWYLGWAGLEQIAPDAFPLLQDLLISLCEEAASLRFDGADRLLQALRTLTPSGVRGVNPACWEMRLCALRALRLQDDFELAALDYCVTFGVSPPTWAEPGCSLVAPGVSMAKGESDLATVGLELRGEILGDASQALAALDAASLGSMLIDCSDLVRVDFAAAGSILNWVAMRQADGWQLQFLNVHRLVAAFFHVIGINEHAKIMARAI